MTIVTLKMTKREETFCFNPPLPPAKGMEILNFYCVGGFSRRITCEIVDPFSHYTNLGSDKIEPARLIGYAGCFSILKKDYGITQTYKIFCPEKFPTVKVQKSRDPINSIRISIESILNFSLPSFFHECYVCLKIYH